MKYRTTLHLPEAAAIFEGVTQGDDHLEGTGRFGVACFEHGMLSSGQDATREEAALVAYGHNADVHGGAEVVTITTDVIRANTVALIQAAERSAKRSLLRIGAVIVFQMASLAVILGPLALLWIPSAAMVAVLGFQYAYWPSALADERANLAHFDEMFGTGEGEH